MLKPSVSICANPNCSAEFKRLGDGKLFTEPPNVHEKDRPRRMIWLCETCSQSYTMRFDREQREFVLSAHHKRGKAA